MSARRRQLGAPRVNFLMFQDMMTAMTGILILIVLLQMIQIRDVPAEAVPADPREVSKSQIDRESQRLQELTSENEALLKIVSEAASVPDEEKVRREIIQLEQGLQETREQLRKSEGQGTSQSARAQMEKKVGIEDARQRLEEEQAALKRLQEEAAKSEAAAEVLRAEAAKKERSLRYVESQANRVWLIPDALAVKKQPWVVAVSGQGMTIQRCGSTASPEVVSASGASRRFESLAKSLSGSDHIVFFVKPSGIDAFRDALKEAKSQQIAVGYDLIGESQEIAFTGPSDAPMPEPSPYRPPGTQVVSAGTGASSKGADGAVTSTPGAGKGGSTSASEVGGSTGSPASSSSASSTNSTAAASSISATPPTPAGEASGGGGGGAAPSAAPPSSKMPWFLVAVVLAVVAFVAVRILAR